MSSLNELELTKIFKTILAETHTPQSEELWGVMGFDKPLKSCPLEFEKKAGAKADACFIEKDKVCVLLENKCYEAPITPRQELLYLNHFMHFYANHGLAFSEHKLVFIVDEKSGYLEKLKQKFNTGYKFPYKSLEKSHLSHAEVLSASAEEANSVSYWVKATYKDVSTDFTINVAIVGVDPHYYEAFKQ